MGLLGGEGLGGEKAPAGASTAAAVGNTDSAPEGSSHYCGSDEIQVALLRGLGKWEGRGGAGGKSGHCCGSGEVLGRLLRERALLRQ